MDNQIEEVKNRTDIVSFISEYLSLTKKGKNYWAPCPFHSEKDPSFAVSPERQIFKCFGCGEGGGVFSFYEKMEGVSFGEALRALAKKAGVVLEQSQIDEQEKKKELLYQINQKATEVYHHFLTKHNVGNTALDYLKSRLITLDSIKEFQLGFAPNDWEVLTQYLLKKGFSSQDLLTSGISLPSARGMSPYDRFRNRVIFPVFDLGGRVVGFSGRVIGEGEPKYLNSPDTPIFSKSFNLYGLYQGKTEIKKENQVVLVEGNLDVISSHQVGVKRVVAPLGTSLTSQQLSILKRFSENLIFCFDQDLAGMNATKKAIELAEKLDFTIKVLLIPFGKDPDECIRNDPESWKKSFSSLQNIYEFYLSSMLKKHDPNTPDGKRKIVHEYLPYLILIRDEITKTIYKNKLSQALGLETTLIDKVLKETTNKARVEVKEKTTPIPVKNRQAVLEEYLLALILQTIHYPQELKEIEFQNPNFKQLQGYLETNLDKNSKVKINQIESCLPINLREDFDRLTLTEIAEDILEDESLSQKEIKRVILGLKEINVRSTLKKISVEITQAEITGNREKLLELRDRFNETSKTLITITSV